MEALTKIALAGTTRAGQSGAATATGTALDDILARLPHAEPERRLLLAAGALAVYRQAGRVAPSVGPTQEPSPAEQLPVCSTRAAALLGPMLAGQHAELLPEALGLLRRAKRRLPPELLPAALDLGSRTCGLRPALLPAVDERGRWLGRFNPAWSWVDTAIDVSADPQVLWEEGAAAQRLAVLALVRSQDPARGRDWLAGVWKSEKADFRSAALATLETNLSASDEPFLEAALDDRSQGVRTQAALLLARLPGSALTARMRARADAMLDYVPPAGGGLRRLARAVTGAGTGTLVVTPPETIDQTWRRDGIVEPPPGRMGERGWWLMRVLSLVPPEHWEERFAAPPGALIEAAARDDWGPVAIEGWTRAATTAGSTSWARALWEWWYGVGLKAAPDTAVVSELLRMLLAAMPTDDAWRFAERLLEDADSALGMRWIELLQAVPQPWSVRLGERYLQLLKERVRKLGPPHQDRAARALPVAATALPPACFPAALRRWDLPESADWGVLQWGRELNRFTETIRTRQQLWREMMEEPTR